MAKKKASAASKIKVTGGDSDPVGAVTTDSGPSKSSLVRDYQRRHPEAKPKEVAEALSKEGVEITAAYVSIINSQDRKKAGGKAGKKVSGKVKAAAKKLGRGAGTIPADLGNALDTVIAANKLLQAAGTADAAKAIIDRLTWGVTVTG